MFGFNAVQFIGSIITALIALGMYYAMARHSNTTAVRKMLLLVIAIGFLFITLGDTCGSDDDPVVISTEGKIEDWSVTGLDTTIEKAADPILDLGDDAVEAVRDTLNDVVKWGTSKNDDLSDIQGIGSFIDRSTQ